MQVHTLKQIRKFIKKTMLWVVVCAQITFFPMPAMAQTSGVRQPTGSDAHTYTYNAETGLFENPYYNYDPATAKRIPRYDTNYYLNPESGMLEAVHWYYSPAQGAFVKTIRKQAPPAPAETEPPTTQQASQDPSVAAQTSNTGPSSTNTTSTSGSAGSGTDASISNTGAGSNNSISSDGGTVDASINNTGANSNNTIDNSNDSSATINNDFDATLTQNLDSSATSGNAGVLQNTNGGSALTGDATTMATIINMLQSTYGMSPSEIATFIANIDGDVYGDLTVDPGQISSNRLNAGNASGYGDLTVNSAVDGQINNNINLDSTSGNARVAGNTNAGNATTGNATAIANVINLINSAISAGESFVGSININGNLDGDILLPAWMQNQLLAAGQSGAFGPSGNSASVSNTGPDSTNTIDIDDDSSLTGNFTDNTAINNNILSNAASGNAQVAGNTNAGNATTGDATTNVNILNLTGRQVVGSNSLLVFVNVLGQWVGVIMDAPEGTTSAQIGNGITQNKQLPARNTTINSDNNVEINNNIALNAQSGDATVANNTNAGNATSGDAMTAVNLANIANSQMSFSGWFGVLFINVFGSWNGSFGVDTSAGGMAQNNTTSGTNNGGDIGVEGASSNQPITNPGVFGFIPSVPQTFGSTNNTSTSQVASSVSTSSVPPATQPAGSTSATSSTSTDEAGGPASVQSSVSSVSSNNSVDQWVLPTVAAMGMGALVILVDRRWGLFTGGS